MKSLRGWVLHCLFALCAFTLPARSATFTVTNNLNNDEGSLYWAIQQANGDAGHDTIIFAIPPVGSVATIAPTSALPIIQASVTIDGTTQNGGVGCPPGVELSGAASAGYDVGLDIWTTNCTVRGLIINSWRMNGIRLFTGGDHKIYGNYIGTDINGTAALGNGQDGIMVWMSCNNQIGLWSAPLCQYRNIISGNSNNGVLFYTDARTNWMVNNYVGTDVNGTAPLPNDWNGVRLLAAALNTIGAKVAPKPANLISANVSNGVQCTQNANYNQVIGNYIGTTVGGNAPLGNGEDGVQIDACGANEIGLDGTEGGNVISGNGNDGVELRLLGATDNTIKANLIGTDRMGLGAIPNMGSGVRCFDHANINQIGGPSLNERNIISGNRGCGVEIVKSCAGNVVQYNIIGLDVSGTYAVTNNKYGVLVADGSLNNIIGGQIPNSGNIISGNGFPDGFDGVHLLDNANLNRVSGNLIGLNVNNAAAGNAGNGVYVLNCQSNLIGALVAIGRNIISANAGNGIQIGTNTIQANLNYIFGNFIGTDTNGLLPRGNAKNGILLQGCTNIIIGSNSAPLQLISGNVSNGIKITRSGLNQIYDNYIGLGVNGLQMIPNGRDGIHIEFGSSNVIGGAGQFNVISANGNNGVFIRDSASRGNLLQENFIGTDETGLQDRGNNGNGVLIYSARENVLNQNVISGNNGAGVRIEYGDANNRLTRNRIGTDPTGLLSVSNNAQGVYIGNGASFNVVGGSNAGEGNIIAFNNDAGVTVASGTNNAVLGNSIFQNRRLGITLVDKFGPSTNDYQDPDSGANFKQNYPVIYSCATGSIRLGGTINSMTSTTYRVEFFLNELPDASGYGEGRYFLGFTNVTTDANGDANFFQVAFTNEATTNQFITATATDPNGNSSEFSAAVRIVAPESFDADGDGMPNIWEIGGGIDPYDNAGANGASGNPDNDPYSNLEEYIADTSPSDGASYLRWTDAERITNSIVTYSSTNSRFYLIQYASQLGHLTPEWQNLYTPAVQGSNSVTSYADTNVTPGRVYRVGVRMIP